MWCVWYFWNYFQASFYFCIQLFFRTYDKFASMRCNLDSISLNCFCLAAARALAVSLSSISFSFILLTSSQVFHKSWIYDFFSRNFMFHKMSFLLCMINSYIKHKYIGILDLNRKLLLPCKKTMKFSWIFYSVLRFVDSGNVKTCDEFNLCCHFSRSSASFSVSPLHLFPILLQQ